MAFVHSDFSYNAFSGPITINCTHAPASVNLRSNQLSGTITPCDWPVTSTLDLAFNNFDGAFPAARAKYIDISHNGFTSVDAYMASTSFSAVQSFDASFNNISTAVPAIAANVNAYLMYELKGLTKALFKIVPRFSMELNLTLEISLFGLILDF